MVGLCPTNALQIKSVALVKDMKLDYEIHSLKILAPIVTSGSTSYYAIINEFDGLINKTRKVGMEQAFFFSKFVRISKPLNVRRDSWIAPIKTTVKEETEKQQSMRPSDSATISSQSSLIKTNVACFSKTSISLCTHAFVNIFTLSKAFRTVRRPSVNLL